MGGIPTPQLPGMMGLGGSAGARGMGLPFQPPVGGQIAEGIDAFVRNFMTARRGEQEFHKNKFYEQLSLIQQGLLTPSSADYKKILREAKLGGLPIKTEASPQEQDALYQQKVADSAAAQAAIRSPMAGGTGSNNPALNAVLTSGLQGPNPTPYAPTPQSLARPGLLSRIFNPAGNVSLASPGGQMLQRFGAAAQTGAPMNPQNVEQEGELKNLAQVLQRQGMMDQSGQLTLNGQHRQILQSLLNPNDPKHDEAASTALRMGILPALPQNVIEDLVRQTGGSPQDAGHLMMYKEFGMPMMQMKFGLAEKSVNRFNGNYGAALQYWDDMLRQGYSKVSPGLTMEEAKQRADIATDLMRYTSAPSNVAMPYADISTDPNLAQYKGQFQQLLGKFPTQQQFEQNVKFPREMYNRQWELNNDTGRLVNMQDNTALNVLNAAREGNITEYNRIYDQLKDRVKENGWDEGSVALLNQLGSVDMKGAQIKYPMRQPNGQTIMYNMTDPQGGVQGSIHFLATHHFTNIPPYLGAPPQNVPGQQAPQPSGTTVQVPGAPGAYSTPSSPLSGMGAILGGAAGSTANWLMQGTGQLEGGTGANATQWSPEMQQILNSQHLNIPMPQPQGQPDGQQ